MKLFNHSLRRRLPLAVLSGLFTLTAMPGIAADLSPAGLWKTIDDKTGRARGFVRIYEQNGELFGKIESSLSPQDAREVCDRCSGERKDKPVIGMVILTGMKRTGSEYAGGEILDPDTGWVYRCKMRLVEGGRKLILRGYVGFSLLGRSQTWLREF